MSGRVDTSRRRSPGRRLCRGSRRSSRASAVGAAGRRGRWGGWWAGTGSARSTRSSGPWSRRDTRSRSRSVDCRAWRTDRRSRKDGQDTARNLAVHTCIIVTIAGRIAPLAAKTICPACVSHSSYGHVDQWIRLPAGFPSSVPHRESKNKTINSCPLPQIITDFHNSFTDRLSGKFATKSYLNIPRNLKYVTTLPCEISVFKSRNAQEVIEANCHVRLSLSKTVLEYLSGKIFII